MKEQVTKLLNPIVSFWKAQEKKRKIIYLSILGGVVVLAVVLVVVLSMNNKKMTVLYSGLESSEATEITQLISESGIKYEMTNDSEGNTIYVPAGDQTTLAMQMALKGYPKSSLSYGTYTQNVGMFTTDSEKRQYEKFQLQDWLMATIETMDPIDRAIVELTIPEQNRVVLNSQVEEARAGVVLTLKNKEQKLNSKQIAGIRQLVANSLVGLSEENVVLTDSNGALIVDTGETSETDAIANEMARTRNRYAFEREMAAALQDSVYTMLVGSYGAQGVAVRANVRLNYDSRFQSDVEYTPSHEDGSGMIQHEDQENASGSGSGVGGVVGEEPNTEDYTETYPTGEIGNTGVWSRNSSSTTYLVNTLKTESEKSGYEVEDASLSVVIYKDLMSDDELDRVRSVAAMAAGMNIERVEAVYLPPLIPLEVETVNNLYPLGMSQSAFFMTLMVLLILIMLCAAAYVSVSKKARRKRRALEQAIYEAARRNKELAEQARLGLMLNQAERTEEQKLFMPEDAVQDDGPSPADGVESLQKNDDKNSREAAIRNEIGDFAKLNPDVVAQLIRGWLREDEEANGHK